MRHRQTKEAATDRFHLKPPRHISTLPDPADSGTEKIGLLFPKAAIPAGLRNRLVVANTVEKLRYEVASKFPLNFFEGKVRTQKPPTRP